MMIYDDGDDDDDNYIIVQKHASGKQIMSKSIRRILHIIVKTYRISFS